MKYSTAVPIGRGATGEVLEAWDPSLERPVALKLLARDDPRALQRALAEARLQARVEHPNVCRVYEVGETNDGRPFIAMQLIRGEPLNEALAETSREEKVAVMKTVAEAVQAAHAVGLIHRDLKPANILVEDGADGPVPYVLDFGIAREMEVPGVTRTGQALGTPGYMSPEQAVGDLDQLDRRTDVFALGVLLYELLSGQLPFDGETPTAILLEMLRSDAQPLRRLAPRVPRDLETITMTCLEHEPERRYASASALAQDLGRWLSGEPITARPVSVLQRITRRARRHPKTTAVLGVAAALVLVVSLLSIRSLGMAREQARLAERFGQTVERTLGQLRLAFMLPPHNVLLAIDEANRQLEELQRDVENAGSLGRGPGDLALGRGLLRLGRLEEARTRLEAAWQSGYQTADVALSLGRLQGERLSRTLAELDRIADPELRAERRTEVNSSLGAEAMTYLEAARRATTTHDEHERLLLDGQLALYEGDFETARERGREAARLRPWFYEGDLLSAEADLRIASIARLASQWSVAEPALERAETALAAAAEKAPSDPDTRRSLCSAGTLGVVVARESGRSIDVKYERARANCDLAEAVTPGAIEVLEASAFLATQRASDLVQRGLDPGAAMTELEEIVSRSLAVAPNAPQPLRHLARFHWLRAQHNYDRNIPHLADARQGIDTFRRALAAAPGDDLLRLDLGSSLTRLGQWLSFEGQDPMPVWREAAQVYRTSHSGEAAIASRVASGRCNVLTELGYHLFVTQGDDEGQLEQAILACEVATEQAPESLVALSRSGYAQWSLAEMQSAQGDDPTQSFSAAAEAYRQGLARAPDRLAYRVNLAHLLEEHAAWNLEHGLPVADLLAEAESEAATFEQSYPADYLLIQSKIELVRAQAEPGAEVWSRAWELALAHRERAPNVVAGYELRAEICRRWIESNRLEPARLTELLDAGLAETQVALDLESGRPEALAHRAALLYERSRLASWSDAERRALLNEASRAAEAAVQSRPDLEADLREVMEAGV